MIFRYADKSKFEGSWEDAPGYMIQTIAYVDSTTGIAAVRHQGRYYWRENDGSITGIDDKTLIQNCVDLKLIKVGSMVGLNTWKEIYNLGTADRDSLRPPR